MVDNSKVEEALTTLPIGGKIVLNCGISVLQESSTREGLLLFVSNPSIYSELKVTTSSARYPSVMEPSGCALFQTYDFKCPKYL